jgi:hypothetical protein
MECPMTDPSKLKEPEDSLDIVDRYREWEKIHNRDNYGRFDAYAAGYRALLGDLERVKAERDNLKEVLASLPRPNPKADEYRDLTKEAMKQDYIQLQYDRDAARAEAAKLWSFLIAIAGTVEAMPNDHKNCTATTYEDRRGRLRMLLGQALASDAGAWLERYRAMERVVEAARSHNCLIGGFGGNPLREDGCDICKALAALDGAP